MPSFTAVLFACGEAAFFEPWQLNVSRRGHQAARAKGEQEGPGARARRQEKGSPGESETKTADSETMIRKG